VVRKGVVVTQQLPRGSIFDEFEDEMEEYLVRTWLLRFCFLGKAST
jgi:hypothetical protein